MTLCATNRPVMFWHGTDARGFRTRPGSLWLVRSWPRHGPAAISGGRSRPFTLLAPE